MEPVSIKNWVINSIRAQMLIIIILFVLLGISGFFIAYFIENGNKEKESQSVLMHAEIEFNANLMEMESFLISYSGIIRNMILSGYDKDTVSLYMKDISDIAVNDDEYLSELIAIHGYFFNWDMYISGTNWTPPDIFRSPESQLYTDALNSQGKIILSGPYKNQVFETNVLSLSRLIKDDNNEPLAVICLDVDINRFFNHSKVDMTEKSYGMIFNENLVIITYNVPRFIGMSLSQLNTNLGLLYYDLKEKQEFNNKRIDKTYNNSIIYLTKVKYDWILGIVIPRNEYYKNIFIATLCIIVLCSLFAWGLCAIIYNLHKAKTKNDMRSQQKSNFLATMSHEIRTPLNAILGMTEIQMQNASHSPATGEAFMKINNSGKLLLNIINDILDLSKIETGKLELLHEKYDVTSLINDIVQLNFIRYESKGIGFNIEIDENTPSMLVGDELRIKQILNNLISNAFKYTDNGEITLSVSAECVGRGGGAVIVTLIFQINDTGQGMTQEQIKKLFDDNTRFNLEANRTTAGAGLGMTITRNLVELMYGKITVKSAVGEGTTINVRLPQKTDGGIRGVIGKEMAESFRQFKVTNAIKSKTKLEYEYMPYGRILIVDDVETNLYVARGLMAPYGLKIDLATSGFEALNKVKEGIIYDVIFMDHMMPKMDGIETTRKIRELGYTSPVVALTANAITGQSDMFLKNGFDNFISKPIDIRHLNVLLNKLIRDKQPKEVIEAAHKEKAKLDLKGGIGRRHQEVDNQLAEIFARDAEKAIKAIETCMQNGLNDENIIHLYIINIHAMKSALANIGENELSETALKLEQAGREKSINIIISETGEFLNNLNKVIKKMKSKHIINETTEDSKESISMLNEKLKIVKEACDTLDKKTAKNTISELREKTWSHNSNELLNTISENLLHSEFEEASTLIQKFLNESL